MQSVTVEKMFGHWAVERELGTGGMGMVFLVRHEITGAVAAVKTLFPGMIVNAESRERFAQEAGAQMNLRHPHIAQVYDYIEQDQQSFLVMEYLEQGTLQDYLRRHPGPVRAEQALAWTKQVLGALGYAHQQRVVHRDLKSSNLMIDRDGQMKVADFGIALVSDARRMTSTGISVGTAEYISPEQITHPRQTDRRADIYSIGVVLYEMLTGRLPFIKETEFETKLAHLQEDVPAPRAINPAIPPALGAIVLRALAKDPDGRYQTCADFAHAIEAFERGEALPEPARPFKQTDVRVFPDFSNLPPSNGKPFYPSNGFATSAAPVRQTPSRNWKPLLWAAGGIGAACLLLFALALGLAMRSPGESKMERYYDLRAGLEHEGAWPQVEAKYREKIRREPRNGLWYGMLIESLSQQKKHKEAEAAAREAMIAEPDEALWPDLLGDALKLQGKKAEAEAAYQQAMRMARTAADRHTFSGDLWSLQENWAAAETDYGQAVKLMPKPALLHVIHGQFLAHLKKWPEAEAEMREAIRLMPKSSDWHGSLGWLFAEQEKWSDAEAAYREAIKINPARADHHRDLGWTLAKMKRDSDAEAELLQTVQIEPQNPAYRNGLGDYFFNRDNWRRAESEYREAVRLKSDDAVSHGNLAWALFKQNKLQSAEAEFDAAIRLDANNANYRGGRGTTLVRLRRYNEAVTELREAVRLKPDSSYLHNELGVALGWQRNFAAAAAEFREALRLDPKNAVTRRNLRNVT
jgi:serine/threonine protein kinase/Flp pilus assembly protein TadD